MNDVAATVELFRFWLVLFVAWFVSCVSLGFIARITLAIGAIGWRFAETLLN